MHIKFVLYSIFTHMEWDGRTYYGNIELDQEQKEEIYWEMDKKFKESTLVNRIVFLRGGKIIVYLIMISMFAIIYWVIREQSELCTYYVVYDVENGKNVDYVTWYYLEDEISIIRRFSEQWKVVTNLDVVECY